uniref:Putative secreted protein n=1 Tax=Anopheles triannulatus TaxID=58253 RepID=A0A2M4B6X1_9DIPT
MLGKRSFSVTLLVTTRARHVVLPCNKKVNIVMKCKVDHISRRKTASLFGTYPIHLIVSYSIFHKAKTIHHKQSTITLPGDERYSMMTQ